MYTVDYFISKFEAIPEYLWCQHVFFIGEQRCAAGHCGAMQPRDTVEREETVQLDRILRLLPIKFGDKYSNYPMNSISYINDGDSAEYKQDTPKKRILAALYDIKKMQQTEKVKHVYHAVDVPASLRVFAERAIKNTKKPVAGN